MKNTPELLSPAGGMDSAYAAIAAGASALYLGGKNFSARSSAQNFSEDELVNLVAYAALRNVRVYIAVNTLYKNDEIPQVLSFVDAMHQAGAAAFILQDPGLAYILKNACPAVEIHASTQMSVHSAAGAQFMAGMGFSRVVLARELSLAEIGEISAAAGVETEVFVHGALCISYSGQCLMSSLIGGRSGNRGKCAQICRARYGLMQGESCAKSGYLLSPKDMMTLDILDDIAAAGVASLKIEGRMKSPEYVYLVTKTYRDALDGAPPSDTARQNLLQIFNRGGSFSTGYYHTRAGQSMMSTITPKSSGVLVGEVAAYKGGKCKIRFTQAAHPGDGIEIWTADGSHVGTGIGKHIGVNDVAEFAIQGGIAKGNKVYKSYDKGLVDAIKKSMAQAERKRYVDGKLEAVVGKPLQLTLETGGVGGEACVTVYGDVVATAQNAPMPGEAVILQLRKAGGTPFDINFTHANIGDNIFVPKAALNRLRRDGLAALEAEIVRGVRRGPLVIEPECGRETRPWRQIARALLATPNPTKALKQKDVKPNTCPPRHCEALAPKQSSGFSIDLPWGKDNISGQTKGPKPLDCFANACSDGQWQASSSCNQQNSIPQAQTLSVQINSATHLQTVLNSGVSRIYISDTIENITAAVPATKPSAQIFIALPTISRNQTDAALARAFDKLESAPINGYLVSTYGQLQTLQSLDTQKQIMLNYTFNLFNSWAVAYFAGMGLGVTLSQELNVHEINTFDTGGFELVVYGQQILMSTHNCPVGLYAKCGDTKTYALRDKTGVNFPIQTDCKHCIAHILNGKILDTAAKFQAIKNTPAGSFRLIFTTEDHACIAGTIARYQGALQGEGPQSAGQDSTYGHFFRGVE